MINTSLFTVLQPSNLLQAFAVLRWRQSRRGLRLIHAVNCRSDFLVSCRTASALACYARAKGTLSGWRPDAVLVSSDSNPEEVGLVAAARSLGIRTVFISHAQTTPLSPPLDFSLSILDGEAALDAFRRKGDVMGAVALAGQDGEWAAVDVARLEKRNPVIGFFPPKAVVWPTFAAIIDDCRTRFDPRQIQIRWHPNMLGRTRLSRVLRDTTGVVESSVTDTLADVAKRCDWVIADLDSNVHLPVLRLGIPTVAVRNLGVIPETRSDLYGFMEGGIVFPPVSSIGELSIKALAAFFTHGWPERFRRYDASYMRPQRIVDDEVREAIRRVLDNPAHPSPSRVA
jgi:hypothetical protein